MRFTAAIISALALASIGVQSAPAPQDDGLVSAETYGKDKVEYTCACPPKPKPTPKCLDYCVIKDYDLSIGDIGVTQTKSVEGCAKDSSEFGWPKSDAAVFFNDFCYIKTTKDAKSHNFYYNKGRKLVLPGKCKDLKDDDDKKWGDKKYKPEMFKWGQYEDINTCKKW